LLASYSNIVEAGAEQERLLNGVPNEVLSSHSKSLSSPRQVVSFPLSPKFNRHTRIPFELRHRASIPSSQWTSRRPPRVMKRCKNPQGTFDNGMKVDVPVAPSGGPVGLLLNMVSYNTLGLLFLRALLNDTVSKS
jgi:hypothetical protein